MRLLLSLLLLAVAAPPTPAPTLPVTLPIREPVRFTATAFGARVELEVRGLERPAAEAAIQDALQEIATVERMTDPAVDPKAGEGGLARLNAAAGAGPQPVEPAFFKLLQKSLDFCVWTEGAEGGRYVAEDGSEGRWQPARPPGPIVDTYGAGDVFMAALTLELARGIARDEALALAARASAAQLTRRGGGSS